MTFATFIKLLFEYLPEIIPLIKKVGKLTDEGATKVKIKKKLKSLDEAFNIEDADQSADRINEIARGE